MGSIVVAKGGDMGLPIYIKVLNLVRVARSRDGFLKGGVECGP